MRAIFSALISTSLLGGCTATLQVSLLSPPTLSMQTFAANATPSCNDVRQRGGSIIRTCDEGSRVTVQKIGSVPGLTKTGPDRRIASPAAGGAKTAAQKAGATNASDNKTDGDQTPASGTTSPISDRKIFALGDNKTPAPSDNNTSSVSADVALAGSPTARDN